MDRICAATLASGNTNPTTAEILRAVTADPALRDVHVYRLAKRQQLVTGIAIYFRRLAPNFERWRFIEGQPNVDGSAGDLLFEDDENYVVLDEMKSGLCADSASDAIAVQERELLQGGVTRFGDRFVGVRFIFLGAPAQSFLSTPTQGRLPGMTV